MASTTLCPSTIEDPALTETMMDEGAGYQEIVQ